ncbi:unnamed protein product [Diamesa tonsa]
MFGMIMTVLSAPTNDCLHPCTHIFQPVCAENANGFRFFGNECFMDAVNECEAETYVVVDESNCPGDFDQL